MTTTTTTRRTTATVITLMLKLRIIMTMTVHKPHVQGGRVEGGMGGRVRVERG